MNAGKLFGKYYKRLSRQGWIKALICGLLVGAVATLIASIILWFFNGKMFYLAFIGLPVGLATTPLFYKFVFKPTTKAIANKIDELGLEERMITMNELADDDSYIARRQRADAIKALSSVNSKLLKLVVSVPMIILLSITMMGSAAITTVNALANSGVMPGGGDIIAPIINHADSFTVEYDVMGEGIIEGDIIQTIEKGQNGSLVEAVPLDGYVFSGWSDGYRSPIRYELEVKEDLHLVALFTELEDNDGEGDSGEDSDSPDSDVPIEPTKGDGSQDTDEEGQNTAGGGGTDETNKFGNGEKDYRDFWDSAKNEATNDTEGKDSDTKKTVEDYFDTIKSK